MVRISVQVYCQSSLPPAMTPSTVIPRRSAYPEGRLKRLRLGQALFATAIAMGYSTTEMMAN